MPVIVGDNPIAKEYSILIDQGETFDRTFTWTDDDGGAINVTGASSTFKAKKLLPATLLTPASSGSAIVSLTESAGITLGGSAGTLRVVISKATIEGITPGIYNYALAVTLSGVTTILARGPFEIRQGV